jgi:hypothetical protein
MSIVGFQCKPHLCTCVSLNLNFSTLCEVFLELRNHANRTVASAKKRPFILANPMICLGVAGTHCSITLLSKRRCYTVTHVSTFTKITAPHYSVCNKQKKKKSGLITGQNRPTGFQ